MKEKILIITPGGMTVPAIKGGAVQNLIEFLIDENNKNQFIDMIVFSPFEKEAYEFAKINYPNITFKWVKIPKIVLYLDKVIYTLLKTFFKNIKEISFRNNLKSFWYVFIAAIFLKNNSFDKVVIENNVRNFWALKLFNNSKKYKGKYYYHLHNIPRTSFGCKNIISNSEKILCVSQYVADKISSNKNPIGPIKKEKIYIYRNCIDINLFNINYGNKYILENKKKFGIRDEERIILFTGRLSKEKGILETIEAFKKMNIPNVKLMITGSCFYNMETKSRFDDLLKSASKEVKEKIIFTGYIDYKKMPEIYQLADIVVLPSIWEEPAGMTIIEAMACGKPVITTNSGGIPEYANKSCIILNLNEDLIDNIKENIIKLLQSKELAKDLGEKAYHRANLFNKDKYYKEFCDIMNIGS